MTLEQLNRLNAPIVIQDVLSLAFNPFGRVLAHFNVKELIDYARANIEIPPAGNRYAPSCPELEQYAAVREIEEQIYGGLPVQAGYCTGRNTQLTGVEYHQGSEVVIAATDCIHLLGKVQDMKDYTFDSGNIRAFLQPKGTAIELYSTTLHYAPCRATEEGYRTIVILLKGTNSPLETEPNPEGNRLLAKQNKFLMVHPSQTEKIAAGAYPGLTGRLIEIKTV